MEYWKLIDINGNGIVSLAEVDKGMRDILQCDEIFQKKAVMMRAWQAAKKVLPSKRKDNKGDEYVEKKEFRFLLQCLRQYVEYHVAFDRVDSNDDNRISFDEFKKCLPSIEKWVGKIENP